MVSQHNQNQDHQLRMPLGEHLEELRGRILQSIIAVAVVFIATWFFRNRILDLIVWPHVLAAQAYNIETSLNFRSYLEPITAQLKACLIFALILTSPWLLYQMWSFVAPGLYQRERSAIGRIGMVSLLCFAAGVAFGYFFFIPIALKFLLSVSGPTATPVLMIGDYLSMFFLMTFALGIAFQTPLIMYQLVKWDIVSIEAIQRHRKAAILTGFILSAVLTPPDPMTQIMMALPLIAFYDLGALVASPSRKAVWDFSKFAGLICLLAAIMLGYYYLWPIGRITATQGSLKTSRGGIPAESSQRLYRGQVCTFPQQSHSRFTLGRSVILLARGPGRIRVLGHQALTLEFGHVFINNTGGPTVEIRTPIARILLDPGKTQLSFTNDDGLNIQVVEGRAEVRRRGETSIIPAQREATFRNAGTPLTDPDDIEEGWLQK